MEIREKYETFMRRIQNDSELRARMFEAPANVLEEHGIGVPRGVELRVVEDTAAIRHVTMPPSSNAAVPDAAVEAVAGGSGGSDYITVTGGMPLSPLPSMTPPPLVGGFIFGTATPG